jgi:HEAT repeat protein
MKPSCLAAVLVLALAGDFPAQETRTHVLEGTVTGPDGSAPRGSSVTVRESRGRRRGAESAPAGRSQPTDAAGAFRFELPEGAWVLTAEAPGFARERQFVPLSAPASLAIVLAPATKVAGRLVAAEGGRPVGGGRVRAVWGDGGVGDSVEAKAADDGAFVVDGVSSAAGDLRLVAVAPGHAPGEVRVELPAPAEGVTIALESAWRASVRVVDDQGRPVAGVAVRGRLPFAVPYSDLERHDFEAATDATGVAAFDDLIPEAPVVFEVAHGGFVPTRSPVVIPRPAGNGSAPSADVVLTEGRAAHVTVLSGFDVPIPDAEVRVLPLVEPRLDVAGHAAADPDRGSVRTGLTDSAGRVGFEKLPAELLTMEVRAPLHETRMIVIDLRAFPIADPVVRLERDAQPPGASMPWLPSAREAFDAGARGSLPVMVSMAMDGERANDWIAAHHFRDPEVIRVAEIIPCLLASPFGEGGLRAASVEHGERDGVCTRYDAVPCAAHQAVEAWARSEFLAGVESFQVPRHVFVTPEGRVLAHREYYLSERDLRWMILRAVRDTGSDAGVWIAVRRLQPLWRALCGDDASDERNAAVGALAALVASGDEYAIALLDRFALGAMTAAVRKQILDQLPVAAIGNPVRALHGFLHDPEPQIRQSAWQLLKGRGPRLDVAAAVDALAVDESSESVMAAALKTLRVEDQTTSVLVADAQEGDRWMLVEMLLSTLDAASIKGIDVVLEKTGTEGRNRVLRALAALPEDESSARRLFVHASAPESGAVAALRAIATAPDGLDDRGRDLLLQQARAQNPLVRQEAVTQIGRHGVPRSLPILAAVLDDPVEPVRIAAAIGLWRQGDRRGLQVMLAALDDPEFGDEIRELFEAACAPPHPEDARDWARLLEPR